MEFVSGLVLDLPAQDRGATLWEALSREFFGQIAQPAKAQLVVTNRYEDTVNRWRQQTPREYGDEDSAAYVATKIDGARAAAKTIVLARHRAVVVAAAGTLAYGEDLARWMLTHEAQHVRLHQDGSAAWGVHRRSGQEIWSPRPWELVWAAQSAIDEYRCEDAVHAQLSPPRPTCDPADGRLVVKRFGEARAVWDRQGDLTRAYEIVVQAIDRLGVIAAYSAAAVLSGHDSTARWAGLPMRPIWDCLAHAPRVGEPVSEAELWHRTMTTSKALADVLRRSGIELTFTNDQTSLYFL